MIKECFIAELKMYEKGRGVELSPVLSYDVVFKDNDGEYRNVFNRDESYTTLERVKNISNYYYTDTGEEIPFGTKVRLISEKDETGPCWVLTGTSFQNIKKEDLENMITYSSDFYKDRASIIERHFDRYHVTNLRERKIIGNDLFELNKLNDFFKERGCDNFENYYHERIGYRKKMY